MSPVGIENFGYRTLAFCKSSRYLEEATTMYFTIPYYLFLKVPRFVKIYKCVQEIEWSGLCPCSPPPPTPTPCAMMVFFSCHPPPPAIHSLSLSSFFFFYALPKVVFASASLLQTMFKFSLHNGPLKEEKILSHTRFFALMFFDDKWHLHNIFWDAFDQIAKISTTTPALGWTRNTHPYNFIPGLQTQHWQERWNKHEKRFMYVSKLIPIWFSSTSADIWSETSGQNWTSCVQTFLTNYQPCYKKNEHKLIYSTFMTI